MPSSSGLALIGFVVYGVIDLVTPFTPSHIIWASSLWACAGGICGVALAGLIFVAPLANDLVRHRVLMIQQARLNRYRDAFIDASELNEYCQTFSGARSRPSRQYPKLQSCCR